MVAYFANLFTVDRAKADKLIAEHGKAALLHLGGILTKTHRVPSSSTRLSISLKKEPTSMRRTTTEEERRCSMRHSTRTSMLSNTSFPKGPISMRRPTTDGPRSMRRRITRMSKSPGSLSHTERISMRSANGASPRSFPPPGIGTIWTL